MTFGSDKILQLLVYIQANLDGDLSLTALSRKARLSPSYLHRLFKSTVGETVKAYTERLRLEHGAFRLLIQEGTLLEVALDCGYHSHETFTRAFRRRFGMPPQDYRQRARRALPTTDPTAADQAGAKPTYELSATRVVRFREIHLAFIRHTGPYETVPQELFDTLADWAQRRGIPGPWMWMGIGHDAPATTAPERLRFDAALVVPSPFAPEGRIGHQVLAGGDFAVTKHSGPLATLGPAYATILSRALALPRHRLIGLPAVEIYHTTGVNLAQPLHHTDICLPVAQR